MLWEHVRLYVNDQTRGLDAEGRRAIGELFERARAAGLIRPEQPPLEVVGEREG